MSLRRRLIVGVVAVALVLLAADAALATTFRGYLVGQVDDQLAESTGRLSAFATRTGQAGGPRTTALSEYYVALAGDDGVLVERVDSPLRADLGAPQVDAEVVLQHATPPGGPVAPFTVEGDAGSRWRLVAVHGGGNRIVLLGRDLAGVDSTYERMLGVIALSSLAVLGTLGAVVVWMLRQGVRPLDRMTATAEAVAADALQERVSDTDTRTEAGRLGAALNTMLDRIESAFSDRAAADARLRRFVADASHELRTPLTSIRGYAELHRTGGLPDEAAVADAMRRVESEAVRMGSLVDDLLLLARLDEGRPLDRADVDLGAVVADAVSDLRAAEPHRPVHVDLPADQVVVGGDEARLRQAVGNLLANVRVHTSPTAAAHVSLRLVDGAAVLDVADEGPGLPDEVAARVFERFYRADASRARQGSGEGSGLGLAIVAEVAAAHGGSAEVVAGGEGPGACFRLALPLAGAWTDPLSVRRDPVCG